MRAVIIREPGGPEALTMAEREIPEPGASEVLVRVATAGVNRADLMQRRGRYPAPAGAPADIPGLEYAGVVEAVGAAVTRRRVGDRVMGLVGGGAYAEYITSHEAETIAIPDAIGFDDAGAIPEAFITAHDALFTQSLLQSGETVLIHAVGSGVGTAAVQLAKAAGAHVVGTARGATKLERARALGMDIGIDTTTGFHAGDVTSAVGASSVHVVLELVGGAYVAADLQVLALHGRLSLVGLMAGSSATVELGLILRKRLTIRGTVMRARSPSEKIAAARAFEEHVVPLLRDGRVRAVVDRVFELEDAAAAHVYMEGNENFGKVVLRM